tara:strand:- start:3 stop:470 length:468 start_codon:yes stop_codon:yes gene_type:complete
MKQKSGIDYVQNSINNFTKNTRGVNIERKSIKGEKLKIVADELIENLKNKTIKLKNTVTTIDQKGKITQIIAGVALINENYEDYKLSKEVKIINKNKNFVLKTKNLNGQFKNGTMYSENDVDIVLSNAKIFGKGLKLLNHGEYIKIFGKAKLITN